MTEGRSPRVVPFAMNAHAVSGEPLRLRGDGPHEGSGVIPDGRLVEEAAAGSGDAFGELVRRHQQEIFRLARTLTASADEAEDLTQEAFVRAFRALGRFRGDSAFKTWLYRIALNVIRSHLSARTRQRERHAPQNDADADSAQDLAQRNDREDDAVRRIEIERALAALPADLRTAVTLRDVQGLEYAEIAALLGVPIGTVESRIFRGRQRLRSMLASLVSTRRPRNAGRRST